MGKVEAKPAAAPASGMSDIVGLLQGTCEEFVPDQQSKVHAGFAT